MVWYPRIAMGLPEESSIYFILKYEHSPHNVFSICQYWQNEPNETKWVGKNAYNIFSGLHSCIRHFNAIFSKKPHKNWFLLVSEIQSVEGFLQNNRKQRNFLLLYGYISKLMFTSSNSLCLFFTFDPFPLFSSLKWVYNFQQLPRAIW